MFLSNLETSIDALCQLLKRFAQFSGYNENNSKSALLLLNKEERESPQNYTQCAPTPNGFTYLGIKISPDIKNIVAINYDPLLKEVELNANLCDRTN